MNARGRKGTRNSAKMPLFRSRFVVAWMVSTAPLLNLPCCHAAFYMHNDTYPSLPALFGRTMNDGVVYQARLQFLRENSYLCDTRNETANSFVAPQKPDADDLLPELPIVLLAARGNCPFERKAIVAESYGQAVQYLIVYNYDLEGEDTLVPMYSEFGKSRLCLLSVTHRTGQDLKRHIVAAAPGVLRAGGPVIEFDGLPPQGLMTMDDLQQMFLSFLALFFVLVSMSGCMILCAGVYGHMTGQAGAGSALSLTGPRLLTAAQVEQLSDHVKHQLNEGAAVVAAGPSPSSDTTTTTAAAAASSSVPDATEDEMEHCCAVCIDELQDDMNVVVLPCHHKFHRPCIVPWLTERQARCPLCKFDVMAYVHEHLPEDNVKPRYYWIDRIRRYRWTVLGQSEHDDDDSASTNSLRDGVTIGADEMTTDVELTERRLHAVERRLA